MYALVITSLVLSVVAFFVVVALCIASAFGLLKTHVHRAAVDKMFKISVVSLLLTVSGFVAASFRYASFSAQPYLGIMADITSIQRVLIAEGLLQGSPCNTLGRETFSAIREFQMQNGLEKSEGAIDEQTINKLFDWKDRPSSPINQESPSSIRSLRKPPFSDLRKKVLWFQRVLKRDGCYSEGEPDGILRPALVEDVSNFQRSRGLESDGVLGPDTLLCAIGDDIRSLHFMRVPNGRGPANAKAEKP